MKIAIIGSGVSGLVCAHRLQREHQLVLFEARDRLGGHTNTVLAGEGEAQRAIDTGFIVFNERTYPNFVALLKELGVDWAPSQMGFSVSSKWRDFEYNGQSLSTLFAQRRRLFSPSFHRMIWDIFRFYRQAHELLESDDEISLMDWLEQKRYSRHFVDDHMVPMVRALWSTTREGAARFPARFLVRFFANHGFLQVDGRPPWLTIPGGAQRYVEAIAARFNGELRLASPVQRVARREGAIEVRAEGQTERFDHVIFACHSDQALGVLAEPTPTEREVLSAIPYQDNEAVLHTDASVMPRLARSWASWNVHLDDEGAEGACLTYWMNALQPLSTRTNYFLTLNKTAAIDPRRIVRRERYAHPVFTPESAAAQRRHGELLDHRGVSYCGAYFRNGFHEDGVVSALRVCGALSAGRIEVAA